jgi:hypothetical protein
MTTYDVSIPAERGADKPRIVHALEDGRIEVRLPEELERLDQYMHVFGTDGYGAPIKRPRIAGTRYFGSKTTPAHWRSYGVVLAAMRRFGGLPYLVVTRDDPFALLDFDGCRDPHTGAVSEWAQGWLDRLDTYAEVSTSGTGIRAVVRSGAHFKSSKAAREDGRAVEVYARDHGCIMTGRTLNDAPIRGDVDDVLDDLRAEVAPVALRVVTGRRYSGPGERIEDLPIDTLGGWIVDAAGVMAYVECPWISSHSGYSGPSETAVGQIVDGDGRGGMWFRCMHAHCEDKGWADFRHVTIPPRVVRSGGRVLAGSVFGGAA